jgi:hypothetical protein
VEEAYAKLGLSSQASEEEVKEAYLRLAKKLHPDRSTGDKERFVAVGHSGQNDHACVCTHIMQKCSLLPQITEAYQRVTQGKTQQEQMHEFLEWLDAQLKEQEEREKYRHKACPASQAGAVWMHPGLTHDASHPLRRLNTGNSSSTTRVEGRRRSGSDRRRRTGMGLALGLRLVNGAQGQGRGMDYVLMPSWCRVERAYEDVSEKRIERLKGADVHSVDVQTRVAARRARITNAIDRLVEDLIQEAMSKGDFDNLKGKGKPLPAKQYHYVGRTEEKLNEFLINSGCLPQWIELEKEIRETAARHRAALETAWHRCGPEPMPGDEAGLWAAAVDKFTNDVAELNKKACRICTAPPWRAQFNGNGGSKVRCSPWRRTDIACRYGTSTSLCLLSRGNAA